MLIYIEINDKLCKIDSKLKWECKKDKQLEDTLNTILPYMTDSYTPIAEYAIAMNTAKLYNANVICKINQKIDYDQTYEEGVIY